MQVNQFLRGYADVHVAQMYDRALLLLLPRTRLETCCDSYRTGCATALLLLAVKKRLCPPHPPITQQLKNSSTATHSLPPTSAAADCMALSLPNTIHPAMHAHLDDCIVRSSNYALALLVIQQRKDGEPVAPECRVVAVSAAD